MDMRGFRLLVTALLLTTAVVLVTASFDHWSTWSRHALDLAARRAAETPMTAAVALVFFIAIWIMCLIPSTPIELVIIIAYGLVGGFALVYTGKVLGCLASYALGRSLLGRRRLPLWLEQNQLLRAMRLTVTQAPWRICFLSRAAYIPIALKNYGLAALAAPPLPFAVALCVVEVYNTGTLALVGVSVHRVSVAVGGAEAGSSSLRWSTIGPLVAVSALVALGVYLAAATRRALDALNREGSSEEDEDEVGSTAAAATAADSAALRGSPVQTAADRRGLLTPSPTGSTTSYTNDHEVVPYGAKRRSMSPHPQGGEAARDLL